MDAGDVARGLHHSAKGLVLTDGIDAIVNCLYGPDKILGHLWLDDLLGLGTLHREDHRLVGHVELVFHLGSEHIPVGSYVLFQVVGYRDDEVAVAGDGIVEIAAMELG